MRGCPRSRISPETPPGAEVNRSMPIVSVPMRNTNAVWPLVCAPAAEAIASAQRTLRATRRARSASLLHIRNVGIVVSLDGRQREATLVAVDSTAWERCTHGRDQWQVEAPHVAQAMAFQEELASPLFARLREHLGLRLSRAVIQRDTRRGVQRVDDGDGPGQIVGQRFRLGLDETRFSRPGERNR